MMSTVVGILVKLDISGKKHWSLESKLGVWLGTEYGSRVALTRDEDS